MLIQQWFQSMRGVHFLLQSYKRLCRSAINFYFSLIFCYQQKYPWHCPIQFFVSQKYNKKWKKSRTCDFQIKCCFIFSNSPSFAISFFIFMKNSRKWVLFVMKCLLKEHFERYFHIYCYRISIAFVFSFKVMHFCCIKFNDKIIINYLLFIFTDLISLSV